MGNKVSAAIKDCETGKTNILNISSRGLSRLPEEIFTISNISELNCSNNQLHRIPEGIGILSFVMI